MVDSELIVTEETSQIFSIESFSYSWLINMNPSIENFKESIGASIGDSDESSSYIEMDPKFPPSRRFSRGSWDFNFRFPTSESPVSLVHADELISNGFLVPFCVKPKKLKPSEDLAYLTPATPVPSHVHKNVVSNSKVHCSSFRRCQKFSKRIFKKYFKLLMPICQNFGGPNSGPKMEAVNSSTQFEEKDSYVQLQRLHGLVQLTLLTIGRGLVITKPQ